jgi:hypothetical protein
MKISCELKDTMKDNQENLPEGRYLYIYYEKNTSAINISLPEFQGHLEEAKRGSEQSIPNPGVGSDNQTIIPTRENNRPDFKNMMSFLVEKIAINDKDFNDGDELIIESSFGNFLELPWEEITQKKIFVFRMVVGERKNDLPESQNNLLLIISNSHITVNGELPDLKNKLKDEILKIIDQTIDAIPKDFKINNISVAKHTTKDSFPLLLWDNYNYVHVIMHGDESGGLCLEKPEIDKYKVQDIMTIDEVIEILKNKKFSLLFLSFCYSGGGLNNNNSLAFQISSKGISKYVIGYRYGVGETSAMTFAEYFYKLLVNGFAATKQDRLREVYKESLSKYYSDSQSNNVYVPILYINS